MIHFLRNTSRRTSLLRAVTLATAGSGVFCFANSSDYKATVSISSRLSEPWSWAWRNMQVYNPLASTVPLNSSQSGVHPLSFSRSECLQDSVMREGSGSDDRDKCKHSCNCLGRDTIANAAATVGPAVVNLSVPQGHDVRGINMGKSVGTGTIINEDGTILTCAHVVIDFQRRSPTSNGEVEVTLQDGRAFIGTVVNADLHSDIAIVKIKSKTPLPSAKLGSSGKLRPGDWVVALGCPMTLQNTITAGIVSCVDRKSSDLGLGGMQREYLQTDCAINQGNSGGPLINIDGEVIGVNIMKVMGAQGLNFAVPIDSIIRIIDHFKRNGRVVRPWLGLKMIDLNDMIVAHLKEKNASFPDVSSGLLVPMVSPGSPADRAGFRPGDVVVQFAGRHVGSIKELVDIMGDKVGKPVEVVIKRANNVTKTLTVTPEEANPDM